MKGEKGPTRPVERYIIAECQVCGWQQEGNGSGEIRSVQRHATYHAAAKGHRVVAHISVTRIFDP